MIKEFAALGGIQTSLYFLHKLFVVVDESFDSFRDQRLAVATRLGR